MSQPSQDEQVSALIGKAVLRQLRERPVDLEEWAELKALLRWLDQWLTDNEKHQVGCVTGLALDLSDAYVRSSG